MGVFDNVNNIASTVANSTNELLTKYGFDDGLSQLQGNQGSNWQGLNPYLIAKFYPVKVIYDDNGNKRYIQDTTQGNPVIAPILEGSEIEYALNWQSPFENTGVDSKVPALSSMLQNGTLTSVAKEFLGDSSADFVQHFEGRTGITKLNSTQTFSGMPPIKINIKLLFRAFKNPKKEVNDPLKQLIKWSLPRALAKDGIAITAINNGIPTTVNKLVDTLLPSYAPTLLAMEYKGRVYKPMVIEAISDPIDAPITSDGYYAHAEVPITICSLTALDRGDINQIYNSR